MAGRHRNRKPSRALWMLNGIMATVLLFVILAFVFPVSSTQTIASGACHPHVVTVQHQMSTSKRSHDEHHRRKY